MVKKYIKQKNILRDLIYIQENKPCSESMIKGLCRAILEPILEEPCEGVVLHRILNRDGIEGVMKRLEYTPCKIYDFNDNSKNLKEKIWESTEFIHILTERYGAVLIWDYKISDMMNCAEFYILYNSKELFTSYYAIDDNSKVDLRQYQEKFRPDRRDNKRLNKSIRKIVEMLNESSQEAMLSEISTTDSIEKDELLQSLKMMETKTRCAAHEIRNQLSICDLYSNIVAKHCINNTMDKNSINNAVNSIQKALKIASNSLMDLKIGTKDEIKIHDLKFLLDESISLSKVYAQDKNININCDYNGCNAVMCSDTKFLSVMINLIKNAVEAIGENGNINVNAETQDDYVLIHVSNDGEAIDKEVQSRIFEEGFTTKKTGTGLGLHICQKLLEGMNAKLRLIKSDKESTVFEIIVGIV